MRLGSAVVAVVLTAATAAWAGESRPPAKADPDVLDLLSAIAPVVEALSGSAAGTDDAPRLLAEALRTGTTDAQAWGRIVRWVLNEKEEKVAAGLAEALQAVPAARGREGARWDATTRAIMGAFQDVLRDAQANRRQKGDDILRQVARAASPAVVAALQDAHPAARASVLRTLSAIVAASPELKAAIEAADPDVRDAVGEALKQVEPQAQTPQPQSPHSQTSEPQSPQPE